MCAMNVLVVNHYPVFGGPHNEIVQIAPALLQRGIHFTAAIHEDAHEAALRLQQVGVEVIRLPLHRRRAKLDPLEHLRYGFGSRRDIQKLTEIIGRRDIDLVQISGLVNKQGATAAGRMNVPLVWQLVDSRTPRALRGLFTKTVLRQASAIMTTGRTIASLHPGLAEASDRLITYFPPVDTSRFCPDPAAHIARRRDLGLAGDSLVVVSIGNLTPQKGLEHLIAAFLRLRRDHPNASLRILGAPSAAHKSYEAHLHRLAQSAGDNVFLSGEAANLFLQAADLFVLSAPPRSEGISTVVLEAMATGLPVIATDVGGLAEVVEDGVTGFLVRPNQPEATFAALSRLAHDAAMRTRMGTAARKRAVERFDTNISSRSYERAYRIAIENHLGGERS